MSFDREKILKESNVGEVDHFGSSDMESEIEDALSTIGFKYLSDGLTGCRMMSVMRAYTKELCTGSGPDRSPMEPDFLESVLNKEMDQWEKDIS